MKHDNYKPMSEEDKAAWSKLWYGFPEQPKSPQTDNSAIIGYWRNGMTFKEIAMVADMNYLDVELLIMKNVKDYDKYKKE